jgi:hypothetical protein
MMIKVPQAIALTGIRKFSFIDFGKTFFKMLMQAGMINNCPRSIPDSMATSLSRAGGYLHGQTRHLLVT